jgi:hypothetical protein
MIIGFDPTDRTCQPRGAIRLPFIVDCEFGESRITDTKKLGFRAKLSERRAKFPKFGGFFAGYAIISIAITRYWFVDGPNLVLDTLLANFLALAVLV